MAELHAVLAILRRDSRLLRRNPLNLINLILLPLYQFLIPSLLLGAAFLVNGHSVGLAQTAGTDDIAGFLFLGGAASCLGFGIFWGVTWSIKREVDTGTLEQAWLTPTRRESLVLGSALTSLVVASLAAVILFAIGGIIFGAHYSLRMALGVPALLLLLLSLIGIAFLVASAVLRVRQPNFLVDTTSYLFIVTSGVLFPVAVLPGFLKLIAFGLPTTYGLDLLRAEALGTSPLLPVVWEYAALGVIAAGLVAIGRWTFLRTERRLRVQGSLGSY
jgi:ABC-2 type transport system permease protein